MPIFCLNAFFVCVSVPGCVREKGDRKAMMRIRAAHERIKHDLLSVPDRSRHFKQGPDRLARPTATPTLPLTKRPGEELKKKIRLLSPFYLNEGIKTFYNLSSKIGGSKNNGRYFFRIEYAAFDRSVTRQARKSAKAPDERHQFAINQVIFELFSSSVVNFFSCCVMIRISRVKGPFQRRIR